MDFTGIESINIIEESNKGSFEPLEEYFKATVIKLGIKYEGQGFTEDEAIDDALTWEAKWIEQSSNLELEENFIF